MRNDWILDVLADLRKFAQANDLPLLAEQLDDTAHVATAEIVARDEGSAKRGHAGDTNEIGGHPFRLGTGGHP
jgi:hypothetical protein